MYFRDLSKLISSGTTLFDPEIERRVSLVLAAELFTSSGELQDVCLSGYRIQLFFRFLTFFFFVFLDQNLLARAFLLPCLAARVCAHSGARSGSRREQVANLL